MKIDFTFEDMLNSMEEVPGSREEGIKRIHYYVVYYENLVRYTKHSVLRKKWQEELSWWQDQLEKNEEV